MSSLNYKPKPISTNYESCANLSNTCPGECGWSHKIVWHAFSMILSRFWHNKQTHFASPIFLAPNHFYTRDSHITCRAQQGEEILCRDHDQIHKYLEPMNTWTQAHDCRHVFNVVQTACSRNCRAPVCHLRSLGHAYLSDARGTQQHPHIPLKFPHTPSSPSTVTSKMLFWD